jgi:hypothetical protein
MRRTGIGVVALAASAACHGKPSEPARATEASAAPTVIASIAAPPPSVTASVASAATAAPSASAIEPKAPRAPSRSAATGRDACNLLRGPIQLGLTGAPTLWMDDDGGPDMDPRIVFNRKGIPRRVTLPPPPRVEATKAAGKKPERLALGEPAERATAPGCASAGGFLFCMNAEGALHRTTLAGEGDTVIGSGRAGASVTASAIGPGHTVVAFLVDRKTTEGLVTMAFAALDDGPPVQLSEDGSGATFVALAPRADQAVAMYIDARRALTPLHARVLSVKAGKLELDRDAVLFVGEGTEGRTSGAMVVGPSGPAYGLLPLFKDTTTFGLASIRIDERPRDDAEVTWSTYPGGLDSAPVAATSGVSPMRVLRVLPTSSAPAAKKALELGEIEPSGAWKPLCVVAERGSFNDVGLLADRFGTLWITYTDGDGTWIERRGKPL